MLRKHILKIAICLVFALIAASQSYAKSWHFTEWVTNIIINSDTSIIVSESLTVDFVPATGFIRRNIDIKDAKRVKDIKIYDSSSRELGENEVETQYNTDKVRIKIIAQPQNEKKTWIIEYQVSDAIELMKYPEPLARLKWDVIPIGTQVTIDKIEANVSLHQPIQNDKIKSKLSIGMKGYESQSTDYEISSPQTLRFWGADIGSYENFTIQVDMPESGFDTGETTKIYICLLIPLLTFIGFFWKWRSGWRKPIIKKRVLPNYQPPEGISPISLYALLYGKQSLGSVIAILIELANRNYIKIINEGKKDARSAYNSYSIKVQDDYEYRHGLKDYELKLLKQMFDSEKTITLDKLKKGLYRSVSRINNTIWSELIRGKYIKTNPRGLKRKCTIIGMVIFILGVMSLLIYKPIGLSLVLTGFITVIFGRRIFPITSKGRKMRLQGLGFRKFLIDESKSDDQADSRLFLAYLPYAILFDLEKSWIERFANTQKRHPHWYVTNDEEPISSILDFINALKSIIVNLSSRRRK